MLEWLKHIFRAIDNWLVSLTFFGLLKNDYDDYDIVAVSKDEEANTLFSDPDDVDGPEVATIMETTESHLAFEPRINVNEAILKFHLEFFAETKWLKISNIEGRNLPATDANGKSDPFVEAILRKIGGGSNPCDKMVQKTETIYESLNPVFREELSFSLEHIKEVADYELVFKLKDSDLVTYEKVGIIVCPLSLLDLSSNSSKDYELPLNLIGQNAGSNANTAKIMLMNSKLVKQNSRLKNELTTTKEKLQMCEAEKSDHIMRNFEFQRNISVVEINESQQVYWHSDIPSTRSSPLPMDADKHKNNSAILAKIKKEVANKNQEINILRKEILTKDQNITELKNKNEQIIDRMISEKSEEGELELGVKYTAVARSMEIWVFRASNLRDIWSNDPFVKVIVRHGSKTLLKKTTEIQYNNLNPQWNQKFQLDDIPKEHLNDLDIEFQVIDYNKLKNTTLGKVILSAGAYGAGGKQWKSMMESDAQLIDKVHPIIKF